MENPIKTDDLGVPLFSEKSSVAIAIFLAQRWAPLLQVGSNAATSCYFLRRVIKAWVAGKGAVPSKPQQPQQ